MYLNEPTGALTEGSDPTLIIGGMLMLLSYKVFLNLM